MFTSFIICNNENVKRKISLTCLILLLMYFWKIKSFRNAYTSPGLMPPNPNRNEITLEATASGCVVFCGNINQNYLNLIVILRWFSLVIKLLRIKLGARDMAQQEKNTLIALSEVLGSSPRSLMWLTTIYNGIWCSFLLCRHPC